MAWWDDFKAFLTGTRDTPPADDPNDDLPDLPRNRARALAIVLADEILDDEAKLGYASAGSDAAIASLLNAVRDDILIERDIIDAHEVIEATVASEWSALTAAERTRYQTIVSAGKINMKGANTRASFAQMFGAGTTTRANLIALQTRKGSRAEYLFGTGRVISSLEVREAMEPARREVYEARQAAIEARADELQQEHQDWTRRQARDTAAQEIP